MEDFIILVITLLCIYFLYKKTFKKDGGCGCGGKNNCKNK